MSKWSELLDKAEEKNNPRQTRKFFLFQLDFLPKLAVLFGDFHYQVMNGGVLQWVTNGYSELYPDLQMAFEVVLRGLGERGIDTSDLLKLRSTLDELVSEHFYRDFSVDEEDEDVIDALDEFDTFYYDISDVVVANLEEFFSEPRPRQ